MNRIQKATDAIQRHLRILGFPESNIQVLKDSSHVTVSVSDLVARVLVHGGEVSLRRMGREIEVCHFLAQRRAPATQPTERFNPGPYQIEDCILSYWKRENEIADGKKDTAQAVETLLKCHEALEGFEGDLPHFTSEITNCLQTLELESTKSFLSKKDYGFLKTTHSNLLHKLDDFSLRERALHGDCHLANVMRTEKGYLWTDFESACIGPLEWDLCALPADSFQQSYNYEPKLLNLLGYMRSWCVAVWCWAAYDRSDEKREAAHYHLDRLKATDGQRDYGKTPDA